VSRFANDRAEHDLRAALDLAGRGQDPGERAALERELRGRLAIFGAYGRGTVPAPRMHERFLSDLPLLDPEGAAGWVGMAVMTGVGGDYAGSVAMAEHVLSGSPVPVAAFAAHYVLGWASFVRGRLDEARLELGLVEQLLTTLRSDLPGLFHAVAVTTPMYAALIAHVAGDESGADAGIALASARATASDVGEINLAVTKCWLHAMRGDVDGARAGVDRCVVLAQRMDYPLFAMHGGIVGGWADAMVADVAGADPAYEAYHATKCVLFLPFYLLLRAEAHAKIGDRATAARLVAESRAVSADLGDVCLSPRLTAFADALVPTGS
jgi:hypothetical protein